VKDSLNSALRSVTLRQLRALAAVVRAGTVTGAADLLSVTPPAVSQQLRLLEETLGLPLAERRPSGLHATEAGAEVITALARIEAALADCLGALALLRGEHGGQVTVGVISTAKYFAPRALAAFKRTHPQVELRLSVGNRSDIVAALRDLAVDLAVMGRPPEDFAVERAVIGEHPHVVIAAPDHPLAGAPRLPLAVLGQETLLLREAGSGTRELLRSLLLGVGLEPTLGMEMGSNETIKQAVMAGMGVALLSAHTVAAELADGRLVALDLEGLPVLRQWFVVRNREKRLLPAAQALWDHLVAHGASYLPEVALHPAAIDAAGPAR
jgi:LysR family transcriptional regulator for metE and metH